MTSVRLINAARRRKATMGRRGLMRKAPVIVEPKALTVRYRALMLAYVRDMRRYANDTLISELERLAQQRDATRLDAWDEDLDKLVEATRAFGRRRSQRVIDELKALAERTVDFNRQRFNQAVRAVLGVDIFTSVDGQALQIAMRSWIRENTALIVNVNEQTMTEIGGLAQRAMRGGEGHRQIAKEIRRRFRMTEARAKLIARDQISKLNGQITQQRNEALGVERYIWSTSEDERVRESHRVMNGKLCRWDDASVYSDDGGRTWNSRSSLGGYVGHPGSDFQCRCVSSPDLSGVLEELAA